MTYIAVADILIHRESAACAVFRCARGYRKHMNDQASRSSSDLLTWTACFCNNVRRADRALTRYYDSVLAAAGVRGTQLVALLTLADHGPLSMVRLGEELSIDHTTLSRNLRPLAAHGWIRVRTGKDRRTRTVALTAAGGRAARAAVPLWVTAQSRLIERFGDAESRSLLAQLSNLQKTVRALTESAEN